MKKLLIAVLIGIMGLTIAGCDQSSSERERQQQEQLQNEAIAQTGMPSIQNFREKKLLKQIYELRDQDGLTTYTYIVDMNGNKHLLGESIGYGIPAATQYTNPQHIEYRSGSNSHVLPQADPNGLYSPQSAEGTWIMLKDPNSKAVKPVYVEPRIIVSPFKLDMG
ncbi:MAG: hypothetical protein H6Q67_1724 [Firmicutes bacterium]|nr:hypothetical protein [Bacillota bacterium]